MRAAPPARLGVMASILAAVIACTAVIGVADLVRRFRDDRAREREFDDWAFVAASRTDTSDR